jgi:phage terminase large subunit
MLFPPILPIPASKIPIVELQPASAAFVRYVSAAKWAGCEAEQIKQFVRLGIVLQPRQLEASAAARSCDEEFGPNEIGYGGARGGGKSHWAVAQLTDDCLRYRGLKCLLLRKVGKSNKENFGDLIRRILKKKRVSYRYRQHEGLLTFANGSRIILGHFQNESDIDAYLGIEYDVIAVEEATTLTLSKYTSIRTCCRTSLPNWRPRMYSTTNPGGLGHAWYKARFIDPFKRGEQTTTYFVPATVSDNRFVNKEYAAVLDSLIGWQKEAWRNGNWEIAAGAFFTNFRPEIDGKPHHVLPAATFTLSKGWSFWASLDHGRRHYTACYLFAKDGDGNLFVVDEHCERQWLPKRHAAAIKAMLSRHGLTLADLDHFVAGGDVFNSSGLAAGLSVSEQYEAEGITFTEADDDRINGASEMFNRFGDSEATDAQGNPAPIAPTLFVLDRCRRLIECLPVLQHNPKRPEDVLKVDTDEEGNGGDDPYDSCRYGVMADYSRTALTSAPIRVSLPHASSSTQSAETGSMSKTASGSIAVPSDQSGSRRRMF